MATVMVGFIRLWKKTYLSSTGKYNSLLAAEREAASLLPCGRYSFSPSVEGEKRDQN